MRGCDSLIDLQEISLKLNELSKKLTDIGDSLWHSNSRKRIVWFRKANNYAEFLGGYEQ